MSHPFYDTLYRYRVKWGIMSISRKHFDISGTLKNKKILCALFDKFVDVLCILVLKLIILM